MISSSRLRNSGRKWLLHHIHHLVAHHIDILILAEADQIFGAEVRRHHDERVAEIDRAALAIGESAVIENLQQHVEHIGMRLLDLVEQHDLIGPPPHRLGERAALVIADIARRRADQPGDRMLLHVFRHVDAHHRVLVVEQECRKRLGKFGLADAGRAQGT